MRNRTTVLTLGALILIAAGLAVFVPQVRHATVWFAAQATAFLNAEFTLRGWVLALVVVAFMPSIAAGLRHLADLWAGGRKRYREDHFLGLRWRWRWRRGRPVDIWCYCPDDDTQLVFRYSQADNEVTFQCETCGRRYGSFAGDYSYVRGLIRRQIDRKLRSGEWCQESAAG